MILSKSRILSLSLLVCLGASAAWADQVVMKNGDRVTGSIIKKDGKNLTIKTDHFGVVTTSWDQVESVRADKPVHVVLADGKTVQGTVASTNGKVEVTTKDAKLSLAPADVATIRDDAEQKAYERLLKPGWGELWAGTGDAPPARRERERRCVGGGGAGGGGETSGRAPAASASPAPVAMPRRSPS